MFRRLLGLIIILVSLILVAILWGGAYYVGQAVDSVSDGLDNILSLTLDTLDNVTLTLEQTKATVAEANSALDTASEAAVNLSQTISDMQPLLASTTKVVAEDVPDNIEAVQDTIPNIAQVAGVIDGVLTRLSEFGVERTIPIPFNPITIDFDLGIDYNPEEPFEKTIWELNASLDGMPDELRSLRGDLDTLSDDLVLLSGNMETTSGDIEKINEQVALFLPIIDEYLRIVGETNDLLLQARAELFAQLEMVKTALVVLLVFLSLTQIAPLYLGWELITGQRSAETSKENVAEAPPPAELDNQTEGYPEPVLQEQAEILGKDDAEESYDPELPTSDQDVHDAPAETVDEESQDAEQAAMMGESQQAVTQHDIEEPLDLPTVVEEPSQISNSEGEENQT